jgi:type I restriction-modification system DNA methylase subunit
VLGRVHEYFLGRFANAEGKGGKVDDLSIYVQESNATTRRLCRMNLAIRGIDGNLGREPADTFHQDRHLDLKADVILANPPFNVSDWGGQRLREDVRWHYGAPPARARRRRRSHGWWRRWRSSSRKVGNWTRRSKKIWVGWALWGGKRGHDRARA